MLGYFLVAILACSSADKFGPGYLGGSFRSLEPWEGGLNLVGFSRRMGLELLFLLGAFLEDTWRMLWGLEAVERRVRQMALLWGSRNRGIIAAAEDIMLVLMDVLDCSSVAELFSLSTTFLPVVI